MPQSVKFLVSKHNSHQQSPQTRLGFLVLLGGLMFIFEYVCTFLLIIYCVQLSFSNPASQLEIYAFSLFWLILQGSRDNPATQEVELTTAPSTDNPTHWGQQVHILHYQTYYHRGFLPVIGLAS